MPDDPNAFRKQNGFSVSSFFVSVTPQYIYARVRQNFDTTGHSIGSILFWGISILSSIFGVFLFDFFGVFIIADSGSLFILSLFGAFLGYLLPTIIIEAYAKKHNREILLHRLNQFTESKYISDRYSGLDKEVRVKKSIFPRFLKFKFRTQQRATIEDLSNALDLLVITVEAGMGFDGAIQKVAEKWDNELSKGFAKVAQQMRLGVSRREALRKMEATMGVPDVTTFVAAIIQAEQSGVSIARILRSQSEQLRTKLSEHQQKRSIQFNFYQDIVFQFIIGLAVILWLIVPILSLIVD